MSSTGNYKGDFEALTKHMNSLCSDTANAHVIDYDGDKAPVPMPDINKNRQDNPASYKTRVTNDLGKNHVGGARNHAHIKSSKGKHPSNRQPPKKKRK